jgi:NMD protein affecting ribosome stability and mRNA decay
MFFTFRTLATSETITILGRGMSVSMHRKRPLHRHKAVTTHALSQQAGVPYEVERTVCSDCRRVLGERPVRRAVA